MAYTTYVEVVATGLPGSNTISVSFLYIRKEDVKVYVDGTERPFETLIWPSSGQVTLPDSAASLAGKTILVRRETPISSPEATFGPGGLDQSDLNLITLQSLYADQEQKDQFEVQKVRDAANLSAISARVTDIETNVVPVAVAAVEAAQAAAGVATGAANAASGSAGAASGAAGAAATARDEAVAATANKLDKTANLSDVTDPAAARGNIGVTDLLAEKFDKSGGDVDGNIGVDPPTGDALLFLKGPLGAVRGLVSGDGPDRDWVLYLGNSTPRSGSSSGKDLVLLRHDNTGTVIDTPLWMDRATGTLRLSAPPVITSAAVDQDGCVHLSRVNTFTNGAGNDQPAVQVALDNLAARGGGCLILPAGGYVRLNSTATYTADYPITVRSSGNRRGCVIKQHGDIAFDFSGVGSNSNLAAHFEGIQFEGNYSNAGAAIALANIENAVIKGIRAAAGAGYWGNFFAFTNMRTSHFRDMYIRNDHGLGTAADVQGQCFAFNASSVGSTSNTFDGLLVQGFAVGMNFDASGSPGNEGIYVTNSEFVQCLYGILWRHSSGGGYSPPLLHAVNCHFNCYRMWADFANVAQVDISHSTLELNSLFGHADVGVNFNNVSGFNFCDNKVNFTQGGRNTVALSADSSSLGQVHHNNLGCLGSTLGLQFANTSVCKASFNTFTNGLGTGTVINASGIANDISVSNTVH